MPVAVINNSADSFILPREARVALGAASRNSPRKPAFRASRAHRDDAKMGHIMPNRRPKKACFWAQALICGVVAAALWTAQVGKHSRLAA
jgi:hypothetical protein